MKFLGLTIVSFFFAGGIIGQTLKFTPFKLVNEISLQEYTSNQYRLDNLLNEIIGLDFINDHTISWTNQSGLITIWNIDTNSRISDCKTENSVINNTFYNPYTDEFITNSLGAITIKNSRLCSEENIINNSNIKYRTMALSPNGESIAAVNNESAILVGRYTSGSGKWRLVKFKTPQDYFEITFLNDKIILAGGHTGRIFLIDISTGKTLRSFTAHENTTVGVIASSRNGSHFASTDGKELKIWDAKTITPIAIKTNVRLISALKWQNDEILIVAGLNEELEIWNIQQKKMLQSFSAEYSIQVEAIDKNPHEPGRSSFLYIKDISQNKIDSVEFKTPISALGTNQNNIIALGFEDLNIETFTLKNNSIQPIENMNIHDHTFRLSDQKILAIQPDTSGKKAYIGHKYGVGFFDLANNDMMAGIGDRYRSYSQVELGAFGDISLLKADIGMDNYESSYIAWELYPEIFETKQKSILYKERKKHLPNTNLQESVYGFKKLRNPSGFAVSNSRKYIATFDSSGLLQVMKIQGMKLLTDTLLGEPISKLFFLPDDQLLIIKNNGEVFSYSYFSNTRLKELNINFSFQQVAFNGNNLLAFKNDSIVKIFNIETKKLEEVRTVPNNYFIEVLDFIPGTEILLWGANKKPKEETKNTPKQEELNHEYKPENITNRIALSKNGRYLITGNSLGGIKIFEQNLP